MALVFPSCSFPSHRVQEWFYLGLSLAPLLQLPNGRPFVRACAQLLEELNYHTSNVAIQSMKAMFRSTALSSSNSTNNLYAPNPSVLDTDKDIRPAIKKVGGTVVYEYLQTPNIVRWLLVGWLVLLMMVGTIAL